MLKVSINRALWLFGVVQIVSIFGFAVLASYGRPKTAILTMLRHCRLSRTIAWPALMPARSRTPDAVRRRKRQRACAEAGAALVEHPDVGEAAVVAVADALLTLVGE